MWWAKGERSKPNSARLNPTATQPTPNPVNPIYPPPLPIRPNSASPQPGPASAHLRVESNGSALEVNLIKVSPTRVSSQSPINPTCPVQRRTDELKLVQAGRAQGPQACPIQPRGSPMQPNSIRPDRGKRYSKPPKRTQQDSRQRPTRTSRLNH